jgi:hypothetical protein
MRRKSRLLGGDQIGGKEDASAPARSAARARSFAIATPWPTLAMTGIPAAAATAARTSTSCSSGVSENSSPARRQVTSAVGRKLAVGDMRLEAPASSEDRAGTEWPETPARPRRCVA